MAIPIATQSPDLVTTATQRQVAALDDQTLAQFQSLRTLAGTSDAAFSFGSRASRPSSGAQGDRYMAVDRGVLYLYSGTAWQVVVGIFSGTNATRAGWTIDVSDNGSYFITTDDPQALWEVVAGAWVNRNVDVSATTTFRIGTTQVLKARKTGWGSPSGTLSRAAYASYAGQTVSNPPTQAEMQALDDAVKLLSQTVSALITDLHGATSGHGVIGT